MKTRRYLKIMSSDDDAFLPILIFFEKINADKKYEFLGYQLKMPVARM